MKYFLHDAIAKVRQLPAAGSPFALAVPASWPQIHFVAWEAVLSIIAHLAGQLPALVVFVFITFHCLLIVNHFTLVPFTLEARKDSFVLHNALSVHSFFSWREQVFSSGILFTVYLKSPPPSFGTSRDTSQLRARLSTQ